MPKVSAGLLMYRKINGNPEIFLVHPGGPFFKQKDDGFWTVPKGLQEPEEDLLSTAQREFKEETGLYAEGPYLELGSIKQKGGKIVYVWAFETRLENVNIISNTFALEWPPKSGKSQSFPEIDRAGFFEVAEALKKINKEQSMFIDRLMGMI